MKSIVILADLGTLRAFRSSSGSPEAGHLEEIELPPLQHPPAPLHQQVSDQAGRFPGGSETGTPGGMRHGESHGKLEEEERRKIRELAELIEGLVQAESCEMWRLAAPSAINSRLISHLSEPIRERLILNLHADLTKLPVNEVEERLIRRAAKPTT